MSLCEVALDNKNFISGCRSQRHIFKADRIKTEFIK